MAVSVANDTFELTAQGDAVLMPLVVQSVRFVAEAGQLAADEIILTDPVSGGVLWRTYGGSAIAAEAEMISTGGRSDSSKWTNGVELSTLTGNRGLVYVRYM